MPRYRSDPLTLSDIWRDGPPIRVRDLIAVTSLSPDTVRQDIAAGELIARKRHGASSPFLIERQHARMWLERMGFGPSVALQPLTTTGTHGNSQPTPFRDVGEFMQALMQMAGLASLVRNGVATANRVTRDLQVPITHTPMTLDGEGTETPGTPAVLRGFVERRRQARRNPDGRLIELDERILILGDVNIALTDALADDSGALGPVLYVGGFRDPAGGTYYTEVWCGSSRGTALGAGA